MPIVRVGDLITFNCKGHLLHGKSGEITKIDIVSNKRRVEAEVRINGSVAGYYIFELPLPAMKPKWRM